LPSAPSDVGRAARAAALQPINEAVAAVNAKEEEITGAVANQVVADMLLRAKTSHQPMAADYNTFPTSLADGLRGPFAILPQQFPGAAPELGGARCSSQEEAKQKDSQGYPLLPGGNPGSVGHPELCPRPCLYFLSGSCTNGSECEFCHLPHPKRPAHLDKKHREMLKDLSAGECAALVFPVLAEKVQAMDSSPETLTRLVELANLCGVQATAQGWETVSGISSTATSRPARSERLLTVALKAMSLRLVLMSMHKTLIEQESSYGDGSWVAVARIKVGDLLQHLRWISYQRFLVAVRDLASSVPEQLIAGVPGTERF